MLVLDHLDFFHDHTIWLFNKSAAIRGQVQNDFLAKQGSHLLDRLASRLRNVEVHDHFTDDAEAHEDEVHSPRSASKVSKSRSLIEAGKRLSWSGIDSHVPKGPRSWGGKGDEPDEISKHAKTDTLSPDYSWKDLRTPNERRRIDELEQHNEEIYDGHCGTIADFVAGPEILALEESFYEEIDCKRRKPDY